MYHNPKVKDALQKIEEGVSGLLNSERWMEYLKFQAKFHRYSWANCILIRAQFPEATYVAGIKTWNELGRYVKKGEKGIAILAPCFRKKEIETEEGEKEEIKVLSGFRIVHVFDISQTEGKPLPQVEIAKILQGETELYSLLKQICPFKVEEKDSLNGANGRFVGGVVQILTSLPTVQKTKTLIHEWAHGILHGDLTAKFERRQIELEAESVAFSVCHVLGLDTSEYSFGYLAGWGGENAVKMLKESADRIQKATHEILSAIETANQESITGVSPNVVQGA